MTTFYGQRRITGNELHSHPEPDWKRHVIKSIVFDIAMRMLHENHFLIDEQVFMEDDTVEITLSIEARLPVKQQAGYTAPSSTVQGREATVDDLLMAMFISGGGPKPKPPASDAVEDRFKKKLKEVTDAQAKLHSERAGLPTKGSG
jgi:hypothetical protein